MMTPRERMKNVIHFKKPDILPWTESFFSETLNKWFSEGLPADKLTIIDWTYVGMMPDALFFGFNPNSYFGCDPLMLGVDIDTGPIPKFKKRVIGVTDRYVDCLTETGSVLRRSTKAEYTWYNMPMFIDWPIKDRKSWEEYKKRLDPKDPRRYPKDWDQDAYIEFFESTQDSATGFGFAGFYGFGAQLMGIPTFVTMFYKDPELIHDMAEYWEYFTIETIRDAVETLKDRIDINYWWEDLAYKHGPSISPKLYREFLLPHYRKVIGFLRKNKIDRILMDCDGNFNPLLDLLVEAGFNGLIPLEVNSGMDAITIRKKYGNSFWCIGNLDKREIVKGGAAMRKEVDSKVPILKEMGGYIPMIDHQVSVEFTLEKFKEYAEYIKKICGYTQKS